MAAVGAIVSGCGGDSGGSAPAGPPTVERNRVEVVERQADGFDAGAIYDAGAPGVVTVISVFGGESPLTDPGGGGSGLGSGCAETCSFALPTGGGSA